MGNEDCFAYLKGQCIALSDLYCRDEYRNFKKHKCPFYKPIEEPIERTRELLRNLAKDFRNGMDNKEAATKYSLSASEVAKKKEYLKRKGLI